MFWGLSSALDLCQEYRKAFKLPDEPSAEEIKAQPAELNILICGGADSRHVIKTLAKRYTHSYKPKLNIYVIEGCAEIIARNMLLLGLALEPPESFSLVCKAHLFMDIFGNTLMRPSSHHYVAAKARTLLDMICDEEQLKRLAPILHIDGLKYKERDGLEMSFSYWQPQQQVFEIQRFWEHRLRHLLGTRYDHREGAFDWDLSMTLKDREAQQICSQEYRYWRETGVAFVFPEYEHCKPNKTLAAGLQRNGRTYINRGYVGDIETGPFCGFGLRTTEERMHNSVHGDNDYRATDVTERNLLELFHELLTQTVYEHDKSISRKYGSTKLLMTPLLTFNEKDGNEGQRCFDKPWIQVPDVQVHFISPMEMIELQKGAPRWQNFFDIAFVAFNYYTFLSKEFFGALRAPSLFIQETKLLTVQRREHIQKFEATAKDLLKQAGLRPCLNYQAINSKNMQLKYKKLPDGAVDVEDEFEDELSEIKEEDLDEDSKLKDLDKVEQQLQNIEKETQKIQLNDIDEKEAHQQEDQNKDMEFKTNIKGKECQDSQEQKPDEQELSPEQQEVQPNLNDINNLKM